MWRGKGRFHYPLLQLPLLEGQCILPRLLTSLLHFVMHILLRCPHRSMMIFDGTIIPRKLIIFWPKLYAGTLVSMNATVYQKFVHHEHAYGPTLIDLMSFLVKAQLLKEKVTIPKMMLTLLQLRFRVAFILV